jgi:NAD(P)-dependent dehydrogenase (short-subunit alcohol dehydrogenase family)
MSDLKDRVALVKGGSRGIGKAVALALAKAGAAVAINYRDNEQAFSHSLDPKRTVTTVRNLVSYFTLETAVIHRTE